MKKTLIFLSIAALVIAGSFLIYKAITSKTPDLSVNTDTQEVVEAETFYQKNVELSIPKGYSVVEIDKKSNDSKNEVVMQFKRNNPQSFVIIQHNTGISSASSLAKMSHLEYVESTIRQFYPVRYGASYRSESLERIKLGEKDALEHIYSYINKDGKPNKVRLVTVIWSPDETYNLILQSHTANFNSVKDDMDHIKNSFQVHE